MYAILAALNGLYLAVVPPYAPAVHSGAPPPPTSFLIGIAAGVLLVLAVQRLVRRVPVGPSRHELPIASQSTERRSFPVHDGEIGHRHDQAVPLVH